MERNGSVIEYCAYPDDLSNPCVSATYWRDVTYDIVMNQYGKCVLNNIYVTELCLDVDKDKKICTICKENYYPM